MDSLDKALRSLAKYGLPSPPSTSDLWISLLEHAPAHPIRCYSLAASHCMDSMCTLTSQYTLSIPLSEVTVDDARLMGAVYLRRLMFLHLGRQTALQRVIKAPPETHPIMPGCSKELQDSVKRSWTSAVTDVIAAPRAEDTFVDSLKAALHSSVAQVPCTYCHDAVRRRASEAAHAWLKIRRTI